MNSDDLVLLAYSLSNALRLTSYAPQIWRVARDRGGAQAISCLSWSLWIAANAATALYAWTQLHDLMLTVVNAGNALCCAAVVLLTLGKRAALARVATAALPPKPFPKETAMSSKNCCSIFSNSTAVATLAVSIAAALAAGLVMAVQSEPDAAPAATVSTPQPTLPVQEPSPRRDAGVDWSRVEHAPTIAGDSIAAYE